MNRKLLVLLALCAIGGILAYKWMPWDFNWALFFSSLKHMHAGWLALSIAITASQYAFRATRWQILLAPVKSISFKRLLSITVIGFSAIYVLGRAGELARPVFLTRKEDVRLSASFATIIVERFLDSLMLIGLFAWALFVVELPTASEATVQVLKNAAWFIAGVAVTALVVLFAFRSYVDRVNRFIPFARVRSLVENFARGVSFLGNARHLGLVLLHSALLWVAVAVQFWFMLIGMNFDLSAGAATLVMVGAAIGSIAQIPGIGGGFQVGFIFCMTTFFKFPKEQAVAASLIATVFNYVPTIIAGGIYMLVEGISIRDLKSPAIENSETETV
jgi:uncharacterized protein (TIRG00374 family)